MKDQPQKQIILQKPDASEEYSKRPNRKPDISNRARFEGWIEEGVYLVTSALERPEMKHEKIIAQKGFSVSKTGGEKKKSIVLNCSVDSESADPYGALIDKVVRELGSKASKEPKFKSGGLVKEDGDRLKIYHRKDDKQIIVKVVLDASKSRELIYKEFTELHTQIFKTIGEIKL
jgi:hypothetical protein